ncbi:hypothetical protein [Desertihabitans brevis]|uniref:hypothetical protein n=1 Tax=Desertihabitans brevis TaxID=2268447 RepID=UPI0011BFCB77|nr:hypothetical protein [Desertihabitans brevis]
MRDGLLVTVVVLLVLGLVEAVSNTVHLAAGRVDTWGRRQHRELPRTASAAVVRRKVLAMLALGVFLVVAVVGAVALDQPSGLVVAAVAVLVVTGLDAVRARTPAALLPALLALLLLVLTVHAVAPGQPSAPCSCR